ncbi:NtaA/DmoA family FMN-dependent monooxygenase [Patulibacter sp. NPDC049589]|uniref:NtaA/DmoA family FMN-dependent monooxygenase n=1 Tax=Patulibacter sp. NPDC049589 TaxID=3154731 RepID=UPI003433FBA3
MSAPRRLVLNAFLKPPGEYLAAWRHPGARPDAGVSLGAFTDLARRAERAGFDAIFLADLVAVPLESPDVLSRVSVVNDALEPLALLSALAARTERIGLIATASTTYHDPVDLARWFATLDHLSHGRAGWNVVTSLSDAEALNHGLDAHPDHAGRYARAEEAVDVVRALWDAGATADRPAGRVRHHGEHLRVDTVPEVPRPPQGRPVLVQAGSSDAGRDLAARTADVVFAGETELGAAQELYADLKGRAAAHGRDPDGLIVLPALSAVVAATAEEARGRHERLTALMPPQVALADLAYRLGGHDLTAHPLDGPLPDLPAGSGSLTHHRQIYDAARRDGLTIRQLARRIGDDHRSIVGDVATVADHVETWFRGGAADGFNVVFPVLPEALDATAGLLLPELRRRGLLAPVPGDGKPAYGGTLRSRLGLLAPGAPPA